MQEGYRVTFTAPLRAVLEPFGLDEELGNGQALVKTVYSIISAGTEGAHYSGLEAEHTGLGGSPFTYPMQTGYGNYGEIVGLGENCGDLRVGDRVLSFANHASHVKVDSRRFCLKRRPTLMGVKRFSHAWREWQSRRCVLRPFHRATKCSLSDSVLWAISPRSFSGLQART